MTQPAERPHMPGYGILGPTEGSGLLPWSWALQRLSEATHYWVATVAADRRPYLSPVWAIWHDNRLWFSCGLRSRKARNLGADPHCAISTDDGRNPVLVEGVADQVHDAATVEVMRVAMVAKYDSPMDLDFLLANATFSVRPTKVIGLTEDDFTGSPTRWNSPPPPESAHPVVG